jgi:hypothetical protein
MTLKTDDRCRLASRDLFKPNTPYDVQVGPDGRIIVRELVPAESRLVRARKVNGRWMGAGVKFNRAAVVASIREDRDGR